MSKVLDQLAKGRYFASAKAPYFTSLVFHIIPTPNDEMDVPIAISKDSKLFYNESMLVDMRPEDVGFHLLRVGNHIVRGHNSIQPTDDREKQIVNLAMDLAINGDLEQALEFVPEGSVTPGQFGFQYGLGWLDYYNLLKNMVGEGKEPPPQGCGSGRSGSGGANPVQGEPKDQGDGNGQPQQQQGDGRSEAEQALMRYKVAGDIAEAHANGKLPGSMAGMLQWATAMLSKPKIPWSTMLRRYLATALKKVVNASQTTTYMRSSRRQSFFGYGVGKPVLPRMIGYTPNVWAVLDTSGSMWGDHVLEDAVSEVAGIISAAGGNVTFISGDCEVGNVVKARSFHDIKHKIAGGGGTDFRPPFEYAKKQRKEDRPDVLVYVTDGCGPAPQHPLPFAETIWVLIGSHMEKPADWGKFVNLEDLRKDNG